MNLQQLIERYISYRQALGEKFGGQRGHPDGPLAVLSALRRTSAVCVPSRSPSSSPGRAVTNYWHIKYRALFGFYRYATSRGYVTSAATRQAAEASAAIRPVHLLARGAAPPAGRAARYQRREHAPGTCHLSHHRAVALRHGSPRGEVIA